MDKHVVSWLIDTGAVRVCPEDRPFWYTSGKLGPLYINTHYLCGGKETASELLMDIEAEASRRPLSLTRIIGDKLEALLHSDPRYAGVIARLIELAGESGEFDCVSGGERRDWFFSMPVARALGLPHLSLFKNLSAVYTNAKGDSDRAERTALHGKRLLHVADLVTEASSYLRAWIPTVEETDARIVATVVVVDRGQGGKQKLATAGVPLRALVTLAPALFDEAVGHGKLTPAQGEMARTFLADPDAFMRSFLRTHPSYLQEQIALGGKARELASRCIEMGYDQL
jgi:orotate phosphoribosyltransferase